MGSSAVVDPRAQRRPTQHNRHHGCGAANSVSCMRHMRWLTCGVVPRITTLLATSAVRAAVVMVGSMSRPRQR